MKNSLAILVLILVSNVITAQKTSEIEGNLEVKDTLTIQSLSSPTSRNVIVDQWGRILADNDTSHVLSVSPAAFLPYDNTADYKRYPDSFDPQTSDEFYVAPIYLPQDARIDSIRVNYVDASDDVDLKLSLVASHINSTFSTDIATFDSDDKPSMNSNSVVVGLFNLFQGLGNPVDNSTFFYSLWLLPRTPAVGSGGAGNWIPDMIKIKGIFIYYSNN